MKACVLEWCLRSYSCMCGSQGHVNTCWTSWSVRCHTAGRREALRYTQLSTLACFLFDLAVFAHKACFACVWSQMSGVCVALLITSCHGHPRQLQELQCSHQTHSSLSVTEAVMYDVGCCGVYPCIALHPPVLTGPATGISVLIPVRTKQSMILLGQWYLFSLRIGSSLGQVCGPVTPMFHAGPCLVANHPGGQSEEDGMCLAAPSQ